MTRPHRDGSVISCPAHQVVPGEEALRHRRRWTVEEDELLADLLGTRSTRTIARRMGRTVAAIWARTSHLGMSPYSEDGWYTASELARILDVPANTVLLWCQNGYVRARKVGRRGRGGMWRIEWDGQRPLCLMTSRVGSTMRWLLERKVVVIVGPRAQARGSRAARRSADQEPAA